MILRAELRAREFVHEAVEARYRVGVVLSDTSVVSSCLTLKLGGALRSPDCSAGRVRIDGSGTPPIVVA
jgi:hypothetical protein